MNILGLIPARGGSKRVKRKNLKMIGPYSLLEWAIGAAVHSCSLDSLVVSSDDDEILAAAQELNTYTLERPAELASDEADSYGVMLHALDAIDEYFDLLVLLQPTSPFRTGHDIDCCCGVLGGLKEIGAPACASFESGKDVPNGAIYVGYTSWLREGGNFDGPAVGRYWMPPARSIDIDTEADLERAREIYRQFERETGQ